MPARYTGPLYGELPEVKAIWAYTMTSEETGEEVVVYSPDDMLEMVREMQDLRVAYDQLRQLTIAMNSLADLSPKSVKSVQEDVIKWDSLSAGVDIELEKIPNLSPDGLPIIKADVIEYSEVPLEKGFSYAGVALQSVRERMSRLVLKVCRTLDLCSFGLDEAPCCDGPMAIHGNFRGGTVPLYRS